MIRRLLRWLTLVPFRKVTVYLINGEIRHGRVRATSGLSVVVFHFPKECTEDFCNQHTPGAVVRSRADEGRSWCRGWSGPAVDALKTVLVVLREAA